MSRMRAKDLGILASLIALGALHVVFYQRGDLFTGGDVTYFVLARSILEGGAYGFNAQSGTLLPPGLPAFLALVCAAGSCRREAFLITMGVFLILGYLVSYALLRRRLSPWVAGLCCLLPLTSRDLLALSTGYVFSELPYFLLTVAFLLGAGRLDETKRNGEAYRLAIWLSVMMVLIVATRTAGVALLAAIVAWLGARLVFDRGRAWRLVRRFTPALVTGALALTVWMAWTAHNEVREWPVEGYPRPYFSQLLLVDGREPELGQAGWLDLGRRIETNLRAYSTGMSSLLLRHWLLPAWYSPAVIGPVMLALLGVALSLARRGGHLEDWYFVLYMLMFILWPWDYTVRFVVPVLPLACLYLVEGARAVRGAFDRWPLPAAALGGLLCLAFSAMAAAAARLEPGMQTPGSVALWSAGAFACLVLAARGGRAPRLPGLRVLAAATAVALVVVGVGSQLELGERNLRFDPSAKRQYPDLEAARWIRQNTPAGTVIMARERDLVHHYARRLVIWFPPLCDLGLLREGILRHEIDLMVVTANPPEYWRPPEEDCYLVLSEAFPDSFSLVQEGERWRVFEVRAKALAVAATPGG
jgi:hypothetical protein